MLRLHSLSFVCMLLALALPSLGADAVPPAEPATLSAPAPAADDELKNCAFITNDCEVCSVAADGKVSCTSTGIACTVTKRWCLVPGK
jgi:hypothetical protein